MSYSLPMWFVTTVLFIPVGKRSNSHPQLLCKIDAFKNLATIISQEYMCRRFFLINFIKKRHQHRCFPVNIAKCLSTAFYIEYIPFIITPSEVLGDDRIPWMSSGTKLIFFIFLVPLLCFPS